MDNLTQVLMNTLGSQGLDSMAQKAGIQKEQASSALEGIIPAILGGMTKNSQDPRGADALINALDRDHDGSILDNVAGFMGDSSKAAIGAGILKHVLGGNRSGVESRLSEKTGLSASSIATMMEIAAPLVMGYLGKQRKQNPTSISNVGIGSILGGLTGAADKGTGLDLGDILDVVGALSNSEEKRSGGGGLLGGLLKGVLGK